MTAFAVEGSGEVRIDVQMGQVQVIFEDREDIAVEVEPSNPRRSGDRSAADRVRVQRIGEAVAIIGPTRLSVFGAGDSIEVVVHAPVEAALDVHVRYGSLRAVGAAGAVRATIDYGGADINSAARLELRGGHGQYRVGDVAGDAEITAKSGSVSVRDVAGSIRMTGTDSALSAGAVTGAAEVTTSSGTVELGSAGSPVTVRSAYGDVRIGQLVRGVARIDGSYGAVDLGVRAGTAVWLDASSQHGTVRSDLAAATVPDSAEETLELHVRTGYGNIAVHRSVAH